MNDDFLRDYRKRPRAEFSEALYRRIDEQRRPKWFSRLAWAPVVMALVVIGALSVSPAARAGALSVILTLGGVEVEEMSALPVTEGPVFHAEWVSYSFEEVQDALPFTLKVPAYVPEGYAPAPEVRVIHAGTRRPLTTASLEWHRGRRWIHLYVEQRSDLQPPTRLLSGHGSAEEVQVRGTQGALVRGAWSAEDGIYDAGRGLTLVWVEDGLVYTLHAPGTGITPETLMLMAESLAD
jgi:hypothetical protein